MIWFTSDLHLGHSKVIEFCRRPYKTVEDMDSAIIDNWNSSVKDDDTVFCLGDVCFHKPAVGVPLLKTLRGKKILVKGNHDKYSQTQYHDAGFVVMLQAKIRYNNLSFTLSHYPYWPKDVSKETPANLRYPDRRPTNRGGWLLCGHVHEQWRSLDKQINVGVDQWSFHPVSAHIVVGFANALHQW